ncbi:hypothetical protein [Paenibacillus lautus]|uniref:hypothetical protein n=1 Tax=Paenibacillus lautus TaxID=1401 RepID=UPI001C7DF6FC|nr:hypothetical protein [Paenibacillus lautus]MBX4152405.1 hypothetical protein [Paenibacillus lautus]
MSKNEIYLRSAESAEIPSDSIRAHRLENGTVFTVKNKIFDAMLMFENKVLHEVVYKGYDEYGPVYEKTGMSYTSDELNRLLQQQ